MSTPPKKITRSRWQGSAEFLNEGSWERIVGETLLQRGVASFPLQVPFAGVGAPLGLPPKSLRDMWPRGRLPNILLSAAMPFGCETHSTGASTTLEIDFRGA